jgi:hypothetical protein
MKDYLTIFNCDFVDDKNDKNRIWICNGINVLKILIWNGYIVKYNSNGYFLYMCGEHFYFSFPGILQWVLEYNTISFI